MTRNQKLLSTSAARRRLAEKGLPTTEETVREWARTGKLPSRRTPGGRFMFQESDVDAIVEPPAAAS